MRKRAGVIALWALPLLAIVGSAAAQKAAGDKGIRFGDIVLSGFEKAQLDLGVSASATGPGTVVDAVDPDRKTTAQLRANEIVAQMVRDRKPGEAERGVGRVETITAQGNVRFRAVRKLETGKADQIVSATGARAVYERFKQQLTLTGPVTFSAEQPDAEGKGTERVTGKADRAFYDEGKRTLQLFGSVEATVVTPDTPAEGSTVTGDEVKIEMATQPYRVTISNPSLKGAVNLRIVVPEPGDRKDNKKP